MIIVVWVKHFIATNWISSMYVQGEEVVMSFDDSIEDESLVNRYTFS